MRPIIEALHGSGVFLPPSREARLPLYFHALLGLVVAIVIFRVVRQDITMDEAVTLSHWVLRDAGQWTPDTNNHMLNTLLMKISTSVFGVSPLSMRLPAILGATAYSIAALLLTVTLFGRTWRAAIAFTILVLNPFVMDYLCIARGYSIALAAQMFTLVVIASDIGDRAQKPAHDEGALKRHFLTVSVVSAIAVFANFTLVVPQAFTLALYFLAMLYLEPPNDLARTLFRRVCWLTVPFIIILGFWCGEAIVMFRYDTLDWNAGGNSFLGTLHSMFVLTFQDPNPELLPPFIFATLMWLSGSRLPYVYGAVALICGMSLSLLK
jgi:hypothetical protein